jgi:ABC-type Fe3+ transport system substrate-binding protein
LLGGFQRGDAARGGARGNLGKFGDGVKASGGTMKIDVFQSVMLLLLALCPAQALAAELSSDLLKTKKEAEAKGYIFLADRDEIVAKAKKEGSLRLISSMERETVKAATASFVKKYPFIKFHIGERTGSESAQRLLLEIKSGRPTEWDLIQLTPEFGNEYNPYLMKFDIVRMSEQSILRIPAPMIDPIRRNVVGFSSRFPVISYSKNLVPPSQAPKTWEDLLKPEFKGKKFALDIRPQELATLAAAWGLEKTTEFARKLAQQQPIWIRGGSRGMTAIIAGEIPMMFGPNVHTVKRSQSKDPAGILQYVIVEPVPLRLTEQQAILTSAQNAHAGLLWLEWLASAEGQKLLDQFEPFASSVYVSGSAVEQELRGKKISSLSWEQEQLAPQWESKIVEALGFPKVEAQK